jgi:ADP-ribose pyrophosphatase YjhB (NUDIX family)
MTISMPEHKPTPITVSRRYPPAPLVGVGVAVFNDAGQVLLVKRGRPPRAGQWSLPGGLLDLGERLAAGARREVWEECAIEVEIGTLVATFEPIEWDTEGRVEYHYVVIDFWAKYLRGEAKAQDDAAEVAWVDVGALATLSLNPETVTVIQKAHRAWQQRSL